uniref:Uncharacterized protein n=1 Tax=Romanomermis culicivorax TaxID=13658 RepID=A0A915IUH4_ROMCU
FYDEDAITAYDDHSSQHRHYRLTRDPPANDPYLTAYVLMHASVLVALCFFVICCTLGERTDTVVAVSGSFLCRKMRSVWLHGPPTAVTLHLFMAYTILLANILMEGQLFKYKVYFKANFLTSPMPYS